MSTYHLPSRAIPAVLRVGAELPHARRPPKTIRSLRMTILKLRAHRVAFEATREVAPDCTPRDNVDTNWRAINRIEYLIREGHGAFEREARMKTVEELKKGTAVTSWSVKGYLYRIIQALLRYLNLFTLLLSRLFFFEFPNNLRHLCTTMPWSIWPALVVLWGVCWMFYENMDGRTASQELETPHFESPFLLDPPTDRTSPVFFFGVPTPPPTVDVDAVRDIDWSEVLDYSTPKLSHMLDWAQGQVGSPGVASSPIDQPYGGTWHTTSTGMNTFGKPTIGLGIENHQPLLQLGQYPETQLGACDMTTLENHVPASSVEFTLMPQMTQISQNPQASLTMGTPPISPAASNRHKSPSSMIGLANLKCDEPGCKYRTFKSLNDIKKHRARHDRRFPCGTCTRRFGTKTDLDRHRATVHGQGVLGLYCDVPGCKRRGRAFSRKDNFVKHLRDVHGLVEGGTRAASLGLTEEKGVEHVAWRDGADVIEECECGVLKKENEELRGELDAMRRGMEAESSRQREELAACREREARLWRLLERAMSRDSIETASGEM